MTKVTREEVLHIADLARLQIPEEEVSNMQETLESIQLKSSIQQSKV